MEVIILSGKVSGACEFRKDRNGNNYIRFKVCCTRKSLAGSVSYTMYRCFCYDTSFGSLKNGNVAFILGDLEIVMKTDENGKTWVNNNVYVKNISVG